MVNRDPRLESFVDLLITGNRPAARAAVDEAVDTHGTAERVLQDFIWPAVEQVVLRFRRDQMTNIEFHMATRLLRALAERLQPFLKPQTPNGRRVLVISGPGDGDELAALIASDLAEAGGFTVQFTGGGVPADEVMACVGRDRPDVLLLFSSGPTDLPGVRRMIDALRSTEACPQMQIAVGGGVYSRAEGLAEEIGADLFLPELNSLVSALNLHSQQRATPEQHTVGNKRRRAPRRLAA